jgi:hypothetical protein
MLTVAGFVLFALAPCFAHHLAVVVNKDSDLAEVSSAHLGKVFRLESRKWANGKEILIVLHKDSAGEKLTLEHLTRMSNEDLNLFLSSHHDSFVFVDSDEDVLQFVEANPGAMGLVEVHSINDQIHVLRVDGKLPMESGYLPH